MQSKCVNTGIILHLKENKKIEKGKKQSKDNEKDASKKPDNTEGNFGIFGISPQ